MTQFLVHRGPDEEGFLIDPQVSFGMRRLSIIDLKSGQQPIFNEDGSVAVVYNGEIFNFQELRRGLEGKGHIFKTKTDTEVIAHLYEEDGFDFPKKLDGMFAIALWDAKKKIVVLVRDQVGIKPLYYAIRNKQLIFGSEIKSILTHPAVRKEIDSQSLFYYFAFKHVPAPATIFKNIYSLLPGELAVFQNGRLSKKRYWSLRPEKPNGISEATAAKTILDMLRDSVRRRLVADVPVGSYLSGGLDSSLVTALASQESNKPIKTFSLVYKDYFGGKSADQAAARRVAKLFKTDHYEYEMTAKELQRDLPRIIESFDEPFAGVSSTYFVSKLIKQHVKVALSGDGADELFGSYLSHRIAAGQEKAFGGKVSNRHPWKWRSEILVWKDGENPIGGGHNTAEALLKKDFSNYKSPDLLNRVLAVEFSTIFPDQVLAFVDRLSMAHSLEVRPPYLDTKFVELAFSLPGKLKIKNGEVKYILKKAAEKILPKDIVYRPKEGFILPLNAWLTAALRPFISSTLTYKKIKRHGFFDAENVKALLSRKDWGSTEITNKIWTLVNFQLWWERYFG